MFNWFLNAFRLTEIVLKHNVPTWSLRDHVRKSSWGHHSSSLHRIWSREKSLWWSGGQHQNWSWECTLVHSAEDVKDVIEKETHLSYRIKVHTASDIQKVGEKLPKLGPLTRALQIHEIMITSNGQVRSKNLPSDVFYENVKIKESRRIQRVDDNVWYTIPHDHRAVSSINLILIPGIDLFGQYHVETLH